MDLASKGIHYTCIFIILALGVSEGRTRPQNSHNARSPTADDRPTCQPGAEVPPTRVDTTERLANLRTLMSEQNLAGYYVPMDDAHQSEYVSDYDKKLQFISGFSGSAGQVTILGSAQNEAALWTDGRYFLQGEDEIDCNWAFMRQGESGVPEVSEWLEEKLSSGDRVGADPKQLSYDAWTSLEESLSKKGILLVEAPGLIDSVWDATGDRPEISNNPLIVLGLNISGKSWQEKVSHIREEMESVGVDTLVVIALDESAWLFNLRGSDVEFNPVFFAYSIVEPNQVRLYLRNPGVLLTEEVQKHLNTGADGTCEDISNCVQVKPYGDFFPDLVARGQADYENKTKAWVSPMSSYAAYSSLGADKDAQEKRAYLEPSLVREIKGQKNPTEIAGLRRCHIRDSATLIEFITRLEKEVKDGVQWDEISASDELERMRREQLYNEGLSFATISGSGPNGAVIHYKASEATKRDITTKDMYLLDSGGQYLDGTTDVTRTFHFGAPTDFQKEAYTRVLMGVIDLATAVWPRGTYGRDIDVLARWPQWSVGLDYRHGTGHGIGAFLNVHEGPGRINIGYRKGAYESPLNQHMFFSDEPGYYQDGEFGIRLETIVMTKVLELPYKFGDKDYLGFEAFTLVPFEDNLIKYELLNGRQRAWLNAYHKKVQEEVGEKVLKAQGKMEAYDWVTRRTKEIPENPDFNHASCLNYNVFATTVLMLMSIFHVIFKM